MASLSFRERPPAAEAAGLLVLHHGRGTDESDLLPLADVLDPTRRLHVVTPRAPLRLPGAPGFHWYVAQRVGYPEPTSFNEARLVLGEFHQQQWERTGITPERTVLGGFSMGTVMSYALGLSEDRPQPAGILAFSGFVPTVEGWEPQLYSRERIRVLIAHGTNDPVIEVGFARTAHELLESAGFEVDYRESQAAHNIDPHDVPRAVSWLDATLASR